MSRKVAIGIAGFVLISLVAAAIHLSLKGSHQLVSGAVADTANGLSPFTAIPLNDGKNTGTLAPGEARWYMLGQEGTEGAFQQQADLTLFFTPDDGQRVHRVNFQIFPPNQIGPWYQAADVSHMQNLGASGVVSRDGNPVTGELLWSGWVGGNETYYVRVFNGADVTIDYWLFTDDVIAAELGPGPTQPPVAPSAISDVPVGGDADQLLPLASEWQSDHLGPEPETGYASDGTPTHLVIPAIALDSQVVPVGWEPVVVNDTTYRQWRTADDLVGWHNLSAKLGQNDNVVLSGHSDMNAAVFRYMKYVEIGDEISVFSGERDYHYVVTQKFLVQEKDVSLEERVKNAKWVTSTQDEQLTLVTCANPGATHRFIIIARPRRTHSPPE